MKVIASIHGEVTVNSSYPQISFPIPQIRAPEPSPYFTAGLGIPSIFEEKKNKCGPVRLCWRLSLVSGPLSMCPPPRFQTTCPEIRAISQGGWKSLSPGAQRLSLDLPRHLSAWPFIQPQNPVSSALLLVAPPSRCHSPGVSTRIPAVTCPLRPAWPLPLPHPYNVLNGYIHFNTITSLPF